MKSATDSAVTLTIEERGTCTIGKFQVQVESHLGHFADIHYFKAILKQADAEPDNEGQLGLLRVGSLNGGLQREIQLREMIGEHKMVSELLEKVTVESVDLSAWQQSPDHQPEVSSPIDPLEATPPTSETNPSPATEKTANLEGIAAQSQVSQTQVSDSEYLEEEFYEEKALDSDSSSEKLLLLSYLPEKGQNLETWLQQDNSLEQSLLLASQVCQFCRYVYQRQWCVSAILPQFIQIGIPIQFFDLTSAYPVGEKLTFGFISDYSPPELFYGHPIAEQMSTYVVGTLLYQALHHRLPPRTEGIANAAENLERNLKKIPKIYQILSISLSPVPEERFPLSQLLNLLVNTRKSLQVPQVRWEVASRSTVGLSPSRLQNEDNYGVRYPCTSNSYSLILGVVADGMGGMAQGEIASKLAVKTVLENPFSEDLNIPDNRSKWLIYLVKKANKSVSKNVRDGGTTLSIVFAFGRELSIAHVGDSRIFLLRKGLICQLSEDHSLVAMLLASGQITYEESLEHPDRSILTKSLGSKPRLSEGYVQDLSRFGNKLSLTLEDGDILILCSDGVWDLVDAEQLAEIFSQQSDLQASVNTTIDQVLERGANDNATILALKFHLENYPL
ncbi:MAG: PP2C family serine/threonine-protein phosphatase [Xenococcaceae cyanobacterium]